MNEKYKKTVTDTDTYSGILRIVSMGCNSNTTFISSSSGSFDSRVWDVTVNNPLRRNTISGWQNKAVRSDSSFGTRSVSFNVKDPRGLRQIEPQATLQLYTISK